jgi:predicted enzyme related to lactoylglutathione lyase
MTSPTHVAQIAVTVADLDRARTWYRDTLGLAHLFDAPPALAFFRCGATRLMLSRPEGVEGAGNSILYYGVDDVAAAHAALEAKGVAFEEAPKVIAKVDGRDVHLAICRDSEGNLLGLING